eukprot:Phypoly_transcript_02158.p1 GENE.Phypoly_transcript_02158~~Phypoly_transcript_02158.p1  ORF type:complete len:904 (+),score=135.05 Phypoly_transcript_02158:183-2894(+)
MKFDKVLELELVEQWKDRYINYYYLKQCINHHIRIMGVVLEEETVDFGNMKAVDSLYLRRNSKADKKILKEEYGSFETEFAKELAKVDAFFKSRQDKFTARLQELTQEIELMKSGASSASTRTADALRQAYHDNYVQWKLLRKFQETNKYGFVKILKRYERDFNESRFEYFLENYLQHTSFWDTKHIQDILDETKAVYIKYFAASDKRLAKSQLRKSDPKRGLQSLFFVAFFFGAVLVMFIVGVYHWISHYPLKPPKFANVGWFVYRFTFLPIELGILFSLSAYIWEQYNINYVFIFKFNPAHYRSPLMYLKYGLCVMSVWTISFYFFMDAVIYDIRTFHGLLNPLLLIIIIFIAFFLPLPVFGYRTRFYMIKKISRVLRAGLPGRVNVSFGDFIMAIHLIALSEFFLDFQVMFCMFGVRDNAVCQGKAYALPILSALPHWCRMFQCVRRWRQTGQTYPHLASAIRPFSTLVALVLSEIASTYTEHQWLMWVWLSWNIAASSVRWYSDLLIDFGFVKFGLDFSLRKQRLYPTWIYYFVIVDNFCLRHVWLVVYMLRKHTTIDLSHPITLLFLSSFDVVWGFQFVFFRMENEHFNCPDRYNIIQDVPLPFTKKYEALARKNAMKSLKREQKSTPVADLFKKIKHKWNRMPWVNERKKLRKSISRAILEVERDHPDLARPSPNYRNRGLTNTPYSSSRNLTTSPSLVIPPLSLRQSFEPPYSSSPTPSHSSGHITSPFPTVASPTLSLNQSNGANHTNGSPLARSGGAIPNSGTVLTQSGGAIPNPFALRTNPSAPAIHHQFVPSARPSPAVTPLPSRAQSPVHSRTQTPVHSRTHTPLTSPSRTPVHSPTATPSASPPHSPPRSPSPSPPPSPRAPSFLTLGEPPSPEFESTSKPLSPEPHDFP